MASKVEAQYPLAGKRFCGTCAQRLTASKVEALGGSIVCCDVVVRAQRLTASKVEALHSPPPQGLRSGKVLNALRHHR